MTTVKQQRQAFDRKVDDLLTILNSLEDLIADGPDPELCRAATDAVMRASAELAGLAERMEAELEG